MTKETETQIASDEDLTRLFAGKPTQYLDFDLLTKVGISNESYL